MAPGWFEVVWGGIEAVAKGLSPFDTLFSMITMALAGYAAFQLWLQRRRWRSSAGKTSGSADFKGFVESYRGISSERPMALAISVHKDTPSIKPDVDAFLAGQKMSMPVKEISLTHIGLGEGGTTADIDRFLAELRKARTDFDFAGATEVHLFVQAPVALATLVGAVFDHWRPVKLYHRSHQRLGSEPFYEYWCPLTK